MFNLYDYDNFISKNSFNSTSFIASPFFGKFKVKADELKESNIIRDGYNHIIVEDYIIDKELSNEELFWKEREKLIIRKRTEILTNLILSRIDKLKSSIKNKTDFADLVKFLSIFESNTFSSTFRKHILNPNSGSMYIALNWGFRIIIYFIF
jgi:hypothetical protein